MSVTDEAEFRKRRVEKSGNASDWTAEDALREALSMIEGKDVQTLCIHWTEKDDEGSETPKYCWSGPSKYHHIGLLRVSEHIVLDEWME